MELAERLQGIEKKVLQKQLNEMREAHFEVYTYLINKISELESKITILQNWRDSNEASVRPRC